ncbi:hypothetical protein F5Y11DRAFT_63345 [Daldinia sp. FL1419]|nr:hypothetical protein F5Y11DRAFT_63345 [Daldinia sp. FL1419]
MDQQLQRRVEFRIDTALVNEYDLSADDKRYLKEVEEKQAEFHQRLEKDKRLSSYEEKALKCTNHNEFAEFWGTYCQQAHTRFGNKHEIGWRSWSKKAQSFANHVLVFMNDIKPALDVGKDFGQPWSGLAIGTLTVLFVVGSNKHLMEEQISSALEGIRDRLPGFEMLNQCYNNDTKLEKGLRRRILLAHLSFIELAIEITRYYFRRGYRRWITATFHSKKFKNLSDRANDRFSLFVCGAKNLLRRLDLLLQGDAHNYISRLQELINIPTWSLALFESEELGSYRRSLQDEAYYEQGVYEQVTYGGVRNLGPGDAISQWSTDGNSSMLILTGVSNANIMPIKRHCWLSPLAIGVSDMEREVQNPHAFFLFRWPNGRSLSAAIPIIVAQLLRRRGSNPLEPHKLALTSHAETFARLNSDGADAEEDRNTDTIGQLLYNTIKIFSQGETVTLIIDRLDTCEEMERNEFLRILAKTFKEANCIVKVLVVTQWMTDWRPNERELRGILGADATLHLETKVQGVLSY